MPKTSAAKPPPQGSATEPTIFVYISKLAVRGDANATLAEIEAQARSANQRLGIRGALVYCGGYFMQWLEGPRQVLEQLRERLVRDPRHTDFAELIFKAAPASLAGDWAMAIVKRQEDAAAVAARTVFLTDAAKAGGWSAPAFMRYFIKPSARDTSIRNGSAKITRVGVMAGNTVWTSALVRHVAESSPGSQTGRVWFSEPTAPDAVALCEYVDVPRSATATIRLSAYTGWVVQSPLYELLNIDEQVLVLLYRGNSSQEAVQQAQAMLGVRGNKSKTRVIGVFSPRGSQGAQAFLDFAQAQGFDATTVYAYLAEPASVWDAIREASESVFVRAGALPAPRPAAQTAAKLAPAPSPAPVPAAAQKSAAPAAPHKNTASEAAVPPAAARKAAAPPPPAAAAPPQPTAADAQLQRSLALLFDGQPGVVAWGAWRGPDWVQAAGNGKSKAPVELFIALEALQKKLAAPDAPESLTTSTGNRFHWTVALPHSSPRTWLHVELAQEGLSVGMVQFLCAQWRDQLAGEK